MDSTILGSIIGVSGIIIGIIISEFFRRMSKIEKFSETYFAKKIEIYDKLMDDFLDLTNLFEDLTELNDTSEKKMEIWNSNVIEFLSWTDKKFLYLSDELTAHLGCILILGGEFINGEKNIKKREVQKQFGKTKLIIKKSLGLNTIEKEFGKTSKNKITSEPIKYLNKLKKKSN